MRYFIYLPFLFIFGCTSKPPQKPETTYRQCLAEQEKIRKARFERMPDGLRALAGKHSAVKYFEKRPKDLSAIVARVKKENATFNARAEKDNEDDVDLRLHEREPGRNRLLVGFEMKRNFVLANNDDDKLVLRLDYGKPVTGYFFPLNAIQETKKGFEGRYKTTVKVRASKNYTGHRTLGQLDYSLYIEPINKEYAYLEWINNAYDPADDANWKGLRVLLYTADDDRFLDWEHPYFDNNGELNPEDCNSLPGG